MFRKVEVWFLLLVILLGLIFTIGFGVLVRQELVGSVKLGVVSRTALFLAELPVEIKKQLNFVAIEGERFEDIYGFNGVSLEQKSYLLLSRHNGLEGVVELIDLSDFSVVHEWNPDIELINSLVDFSNPEFAELRRDNGESRYVLASPLLTQEGGLIFHANSPLVKVDMCSNLVWQNQEEIFHHSNEVDSEGNFWVPSRMYPMALEKKLVGSKVGNYYDDAITKLSPEGEILFQKSVSEILIENGYKYLLFANTHEDSFLSDPVHLNDIQPVLESGPYWQKGDVFLSIRNQSMVALYRPDSNELVWVGTGALARQHDIGILSDSKISIFNNNSFEGYRGSFVDGFNEMVVYDFATQSYSKYLAESMQQHEVKTVNAGKGQILDNGDLFVEESNFGRLVYFDAEGKLLWSYVNRLDDDKIYPLGWARLLATDVDLAVVEKIILEKGRCND